MKFFTIIIPQFFKLIVWKLYDLFMYFKHQEWQLFDEFGITMYLGMFGNGKTSSMVRDLYSMLEKYNKKKPQVTVLTNIELKNVPKNTNIIEFTNHEQILKAPDNTIILLDEISTLFNSRNWSKEGISPQVLSIITQVRKHKKYLMCTAQRFGHVDKTFRDLTFTVRVCNLYFRRWQFVTVYDAWDYSQAEGRRELLTKKYWYSCIQTNKDREKYDTTQLVTKLQQMDYLTSNEIIEQQGDTRVNLVQNIEPGKISKLKKNVRKTFGGIS